MKRYRSRKRTFKRRSFKRTRRVARVGQVKRMISRNTETKWRQIANDSINTRYGGAGPDISILNALEQGTGQAQRVGRQVAMTSADITLLFVSRQNLFVRCRILIFIDKQSSGMAPVSAAMLFAAVGTLDAQTLMTPVNPDLFPSRFTLLRDKTVGVGYENGPTPIAMERTVKFKINLRKTKVQYTAPEANLAAMSKNVLYLFILSDEAVTDNQPAVTARTLLRYKDA